jgi:hypothetical protein
MGIGRWTRNRIWEMRANGVRTILARGLGVKNDDIKKKATIVMKQIYI